MNTRGSSYVYVVRIKTSVTLPSDLLASIDAVDGNRSAFIDKAARAYLARLGRQRSNKRDMEIINRNADRLNREAVDVLDYPSLR